MNSIGRYQLVERVGQGGMGVVYRAFDTLLERVVAVKLISEAIEAGPEQRERFFREARAAGQLSHRNIITIHDLGEHQGQPYLAMEYLDGEDLQRRLGGPDRMSLARKVEIIIQVCEGLDYAHARGVVHRDIKPANIFITEGGTVKILDFGLARLVSSELTNSNKIVGTVNYMAPELVRGERADHRSDVFSAGVVFYELLGGRKAFEGDSFAATLFKILQEEPESLTRIEPSLPAALVAIVERALAKPRDERYQHMADMLRDMAVYRQQLIASARPPSGGHGRPPDQSPVRPPSAPALPPDAPTIVNGAGPFSGVNPPAPPLLTPSPGAPAAELQRATARSPAFDRRIWLAAAAVLLAVLAFATWAARAPRSARPSPSVVSAPPSHDPAAVTAAVRQASQALEAGNFVEAQQHADAALALDPNHAEARRVREWAVGTASHVSRGLKEAQAHYDAGRFDEAVRAAGDVLSVAPGQPDATRLMQEGAARVRRRAADEARARMVEEKATARAADAAGLAAPMYKTAIAAERAAQRRYEAGRFGEAAAKYYEASGLFRSAALTAHSAAAFAAEAARTAAERTASERVPRQAEDRPRDERPPLPQPTPPEPPPSQPVSRSPDPLPARPMPAPPAGPKAVPAPSLPPPEPSAEGLIRTVLASYETALETRNLSALKRLWPSLTATQESAFRSEFQHASRIDVEIESPRIDVAGASATAAFLRRYELVTTDRQRLTSQSLATMTLRRTDAGWVIEQVRFASLR
jgi:eukaryotic-like serine/threonine-protein kinase